MHRLHTNTKPFIYGTWASMDLRTNVPGTNLHGYRGNSAFWFRSLSFFSFPSSLIYWGSCMLVKYSTWSHKGSSQRFANNIIKANWQDILFFSHLWVDERLRWKPREKMFMLFTWEERFRRWFPLMKKQMSHEPLFQGWGCASSSF